jgi:hypothetical protein
VNSTTDRRAEYYQRAAKVIAEDPLGFYTRAEKGRRYQSGTWRPIPKRAANVVQLRSRTA